MRFDHPDLPPRLEGVPVGGRVVVAMSGGVDSSVCAAVLQAQGYDVVGVTLQLYASATGPARKGACCAGQDIHDAKRVAERIGIPHYVFDYEDRFKTSVIDAFADSYLAGETPIPCVTCNQTVKFTDLLHASRELGAAALVTGHYVEWRLAPSGPEIYRAADSERDQSYFLFATTRAQLRDLRFPLGTLPKPAVRALASHFGLPVAEKPDSQDICFVPSGRYADVIAKLRPEAADPGEIVHIDGRVLGRHQGIMHFTIGQRRGLGIASGEPLFVVKIDRQRRQVVVGPRSCLHTTRILLRTPNWLGPDGDLAPGRGEMAIYARVRSTRPPRAATLSADEVGTSVTLHEGEQGVAAGQACVFYADGSPRARLLGGGIIASARNAGHDQTSHHQPDAAPPFRAAHSG